MCNEVNDLNKRGGDAAPGSLDWDPMRPMSQIMPPSVWEARLKDIERRLEEMESLLLVMHSILNNDNFRRFRELAEARMEALEALKADRLSRPDDDTNETRTPSRVREEIRR